MAVRNVEEMRETLANMPPMPADSRPRAVPPMQTVAAPPIRTQRPTGKKKAQADPLAGYIDTVTMASIGICAAIWALLWFVNGAFSVSALQRIFGVQWYAGWLAQIAATVIEAHLWRVRIAAAYPVLIAVCLFDVLTSAIGLVTYGLARGYMTLPAADSAILAGVLYPYGVATMIAAAIALSVEPALTALARYMLSIK